MTKQAQTVSQRVDLVYELIVRDVRLRYRDKRLGPLWSQLNPIATVAIFTLLFTVVIPLDIPDYPVFVFIGYQAWQWFMGSVSASTSGFIANRDLVRHPRFPVHLLVPVAVGTDLAYYLFSLPVVLGAVVVWTGRIPATVAWLPVLIVVQYLLCAGLGYILAVVNFFVRDTADVVAIGLRLLFYATPVLYDADRLRGTPFHLLFDVNPMAHLITAQRDVVLFGRAPSFGVLAIIAAAATILVLVGLRSFQAVQGRLPDEV